MAQSWLNKKHQERRQDEASLAQTCKRRMHRSIMWKSGNDPARERNRASTVEPHQRVHASMASCQTTGVAVRESQSASLNSHLQGPYAREMHARHSTSARQGNVRTPNSEAEGRHIPSSSNRTFQIAPQGNEPHRPISSHRESNAAAMGKTSKLHFVREGKKSQEFRVPWPVPTISIGTEPTRSAHLADPSSDLEPANSVEHRRR